MMTARFRLNKLASVAVAVVGMGTALPQLAAAETITYGPMLVRGATPDTMIVRWGTQGASDPGLVSFRKKGDVSFNMVSGGNSRDHEVLLKGLSVGTEYEYSIASGSATSSTYAFNTCPAAGMPMDVVFYGDSRSDKVSHARVISQVQKHNPEILFESGDIVPAGIYATYLDEFFPVVKDLVATTPFQAVPGNHDAALPFAGNYGAIFPSLRPSGDAWKSYYAFVCGNSMFIGLDSNDITDSDQLDYLNGKLRAATLDTSVEHVFVWFHHAPYSPGSHGDNGTVQSKWVPIFNDPLNKVTAVFSGHDHLYARMKDSKSDVLYIVSGGAGADLYSDTKASRATKVVSKKAYNFVALHIAGLTVSGVAYDDTDTEIDRFSVKKPMIDPPDLGGTPPTADMGTGTEDPPPPPDPKGGCAMSGVSSRTVSSASSLGVLLGFFGLALLRRRRYV